MELPEFNNEFAGRQEHGVDLIDAGPAALRLLDRVGNEDLTRLLLATSFWRAWLASDLAQPIMVSLGASSGVFGRSRTIVVWRDNVRRFDLLVLDPSLPTTFVPKAIGANLRGAMTEVIMRGAVRAFGAPSGLASKTCPTVITGWDTQIPNPSSRRQACLYTRRDAQPGDSGSALVTDDDWIVGFAFERSKPGESPAQCSWIWADSVLNRLNVKRR